MPVVRLVDDELTQAMTEYVLLHVLRYHRRMPEFERRSASGAGSSRCRRQRTGAASASSASARSARTRPPAGRSRLSVAGWSRSPKSSPGVEGFHGAGQLAAFAARTEILVCLLPLTDETRGIIDAGPLAALPRGATVINAARGGHVVDGDLLAALDSGHIAGATLDVFQPEPLPPAHPFWTHPKVTVTPHIASTTNARSSVPQIVDNIRRAVREGRSPLNRAGQVEAAPRVGYQRRRGSGAASRCAGG